MTPHPPADLRLLGVLLLAALLALAFLHWALIPCRYVPRFRVATLRTRLLLRLHPSRGFMTLPGLWLHWSRWAALRGSGRVRPGLPLWCRVTHPSSHAVLLGRAHYRHRLWRARRPLVRRNRSGLVVALTTGPRKWMRTLASHPDLPDRDRPMIRMFSWMVCQSRCR